MFGRILSRVFAVTVLLFATGLYIAAQDGPDAEALDPSIEVHHHAGLVVRPRNVW